MKKLNWITICIVLVIVFGIWIEPLHAGRRRSDRKEKRKAETQDTEVAPTNEEKAEDSVSKENSDLIPDISAEIPVGTVALVALDTTLDCEKHGAGHKFTGTLQADIVSGSVLLARKGSKVYGTIIKSKKARRVAGQSTLEFKLTGVMVENQLRSIDSSIIKVAAARSGKGTIKKTAGGAAIGEIVDNHDQPDIGDLTDDHDKAKTGAKIGGAASILSKGETAVVDAGTVIDFSIGEPGSNVSNEKAQTIDQPATGRGRRRGR